MQLDDLLDMDELAQDIENGYVTERTHPVNPHLRVLNYADKCQYEPYWTEVTRKTRGLIYNSETLEIVARPFEKFFNYGQEAGVEFDLDAPVIGAFDKLDGSLGVAYWDGEKYAIATRGSFESDQAIHATEWLHKPENYLTLETVQYSAEVGYTSLFEIVFPENRIVVDYGTLDALIPICDVHMESGESHPVADRQIGGSGITLRDVLSIPDRENAEGLIVWIDRHTAVKIKQADYVELHRIVSNLSQKEIWRQLSAGTYDEFVQKLPDEFYAWADATAEELRVRHARKMRVVQIHLNEMLDEELATRKEQAIWIQDVVPSQYRGLVFSLLDGRDISPAIWKMLEPVGANPMKIIVE